MLTVKDVYDFIDGIAPFSKQCGWDNSGLIIGNKSCEITKIMTALDITIDVANEAVEKGAELIVTHHPIIFRAVKKIDTLTPMGILLSAGISVISAHTSFDSAKGGMNKVLCDKIGLTPEENLPLAVDDAAEIGNVCNLIKPMQAKELAELLKSRLGCKTVRYSDCGGEINRVGVCSGSGAEYFVQAKELGCQALITGDVKHHDFIDAYNCGVSLFDAGHFYTERLFSGFFEEKLSRHFSEAEVFASRTEKDIVMIME